MATRVTRVRIQTRNRAALVQAAQRLERELNRKLRNTKVRVRVK